MFDVGRGGVWETLSLRVWGLRFLGTMDISWNVGVWNQDVYLEPFGRFGV